MSLTRTQRKWADCFIEVRDMDEASKKAMIPQKNGRKYIVNKDVLIYICRKDNESEEVTLKDLTKDLDHAIAISKVYHQASALVTAIRTKAQLHGHLKEQQEVEHKGNVHHRVDREDLDDRVRQIMLAGFDDALQ